MINISTSFSQILVVIMITFTTIKSTGDFTAPLIDPYCMAIGRGDSEGSSDTPFFPFFWEGGGD